MLNVQLWHPMDKLPESQVASPVKSEDMASYEAGWNMPTSGSHSSFFIGSDCKSVYLLIELCNMRSINTRII